jgi:hypothetical protein
MDIKHGQIFVDTEKNNVSYMVLRNPLTGKYGLCTLNVREVSQVVWYNKEDLISIIQEADLIEFTP